MSGEPGGECHMLPAILLAWLSKFLLYSPGLIHLRGYESIQFPTTHLPPFVPAPRGRDDV